jgi:hypothetical protein
VRLSLCGLCVCVCGSGWVFSAAQDQLTITLPQSFVGGPFPNYTRFYQETDFVYSKLVRATGSWPLAVNPGAHGPMVSLFVVSTSAPPF